jgi:hypothetical protein
VETYPLANPGSIRSWTGSVLLGVVGARGSQRHITPSSSLYVGAGLGQHHRPGQGLHARRL